MKATNFMEMTNEELQVKLVSLKQELLNLRFKPKSGNLENNSQIRTCRKDIAKCMTIIRQRELGISAEPTKTGKSKKAAK